MTNTFRIKDELIFWYIHICYTILCSFVVTCFHNCSENLNKVPCFVLSFLTEVTVNFLLDKILNLHKTSDSSYNNPVNKTVIK